MIYLIDASVYVFRAYYSMPPEMIDRDGNPAHATFGFARFLSDLIERVKPQYLAVAFDESLTTSFRNQIYPAYKANREPPPADLKLQFLSLLEERYFLRSVEYLQQEAIALNTGKSKMNVEVVRWPDDVLKKFAEASTGILKKEEAKGEISAKGTKTLLKLMTDLGYV